MEKEKKLPQLPVLYNFFGTFGGFVLLVILVLFFIFLLNLLTIIDIEKYGWQLVFLLLASSQLLILSFVMIQISQDPYLYFALVRQDKAEQKREKDSEKIAIGLYIFLVIFFLTHESGIQVWNAVILFITTSLNIVCLYIWKSYKESSKIDFL